ncbi:SNF-related serine/threonine-protein kinase isoform X2 [Hypomesus transpacificus]|nr:SNF-related serine/threonine-protein kinase isoform X2 [Hypomesus transpacificus]
MLVCGQPPFQEANDSETLTMIMDCKYTVPTHVSNACKDLIDRMLQRDPKRRASLEEIEGHPWLQGVDPSPATKFTTPLVSHKNLSDEEHNSIIQRMVLGDIADREAIVEALETNKYNHITATYFLLAERILREKQEKEVQTRSSSPSNIKAHFRQSWPTKMDMHQDIEDSLAASSISHAGGPQSPARSTDNLLNGHRSKALLELSRRDEDPQGATGSAPGGLRAGTSTPSSSGSAKQRTCLFRVEEDEEEEEEQEASQVPTQVILRRKPPSITSRLTSRKSAPVLNQIYEEEGESDDDFDLEEGLPPKLSRLKMNMAAASASPGSNQKRYHRRKSQGRGSSCSSSETSDDDSESHRRRLDKDAGFGYSWNRRDSSEGPPGSSGGNGGGSGGGGGQSRPPGESSDGADRDSPPGGEGGGGGNGGGGGGGGGSKGQGSPSSCSNSSSNQSSSGGPGGSCRSRGSTNRSAGDLVESLRLMSLCLNSHLQQQRDGRGTGPAGAVGKFLMDPLGLSSVSIQEKSSWKMCVGSTGSLDTLTLPTTIPGSAGGYPHHRAASLGCLGGCSDSTPLSVEHPGDYPDHRAASKGHPRGSTDSRAASAERPKGYSDPRALPRPGDGGSMRLKNGLLQLPLCEKTISVNIQRSSREGLLCASTQASCCQVI